MSITDFFIPPSIKTHPESVGFAEGVLSLSDQVLEEASAEEAKPFVWLIGLPDDAPTSFSSSKAPTFLAADEIRKHLYRLSRPTHPVAVLDAGNLKIKAETQSEALKVLAELFGDLMRRNQVLLLFGGEHYMELGQFMAYEQLQQRITALSIDNRIDLSQGYSDTHDLQLDALFAHRPNYLFHYIHLAHQSYLIDPQVLAALEGFHFEALRLGAIRENIRDTEALLRQADMLSVDVASLSRLYAPGSQGAEIFGLSGEEACQLTWYGGCNPRMRSAGFYGYDPKADNKERNTASTLATMLWYFIDGMQMRRHHPVFEEKEYIHYVVALGKDIGSIDFYKSRYGEKWWMAVPFSKDIWSYNAVVPCTYSDYLQASSHGEVPKRWLLMHNKMN